ncbi:MAG TPA: DUF1501 domain-containing protein [Abditibacteriaceae bacterium]|nr:DUF1501 domain-containing protein [Abditibacteriaceae bacterium]
MKRTKRQKARIWRKPRRFCYAHPNFSGADAAQGNSMKTDWYACDGAGFQTENSATIQDTNVLNGSVQRLDVQDRNVQDADVLNAEAMSANMSQTARSLAARNSSAQNAATRNATTHSPISRRQMLAGGALAALGWVAGSRSALADVAFRTRPHSGSSRNVLVTIFLRGGADGLNIVVPYGEDAYGRNRQTIGIAAPRDLRQSPRALDLDGFFGLHPALAPVYPLYRQGLMGFVHACGSGDRTHSHFEAMGTMERGLENERSGDSSGWIARHLLSTRSDTASLLRAIAFGHVMPDALRGATDATTLNSLDDLHLYVPQSLSAKSDANRAQLHQSLQALYGGQDEIARAGRETLQILKTLRTLDPAHQKPGHGAVYPDSELGNGLRQVAWLVKANVGLETACLDRGGWDTHVAQGASGGFMALQLDDVGRSLAAFARDMGRDIGHVTVVVMTEFGRRLQENSGLGTDHGRGGVMMLLGGGVRGGHVFARWPGLENDQLEPPGDLRVTTDYRDVLGEVLNKRLGNQSLDAVFPGAQPQFHGLVTS